jgi:uncharacterized protein YjbI with pentapeptide repeats
MQRAEYRCLHDDLTPAIITTFAGGQRVVADAKKIDPYDVEALEKSLNDSATRVSTVWITYLAFAVYLAATFSNVSQRQLMNLAGSIKFPTLNIDLHLVFSFLVLPISFVILHTYVLLQVVLLARTTAVYEEALHHTNPLKSDQERIRQRLANTLFAQIFAGSTREREGIIGVLLVAMAWATLVFVPAFVLITIQAVFLPYHSILITWVHRVTVLFDLLVTLALWNAALNPRSDISWRRLAADTKLMAFAIILLLFSWIALSFPGEPQSAWTRYYSATANPTKSNFTDCAKSSLFSIVLPPSFDRFVLQGEKFVDDEVLAKIERADRARNLKPYDGDRTVDFRRRDLRCGIFTGADFRHADFGEADLSGADFGAASLSGAAFENAILKGAVLAAADLSFASFAFANMQGAVLNGATLHGANLLSAKLTGARLIAARLEGGSLRGLDLRGADFQSAQLQGANLDKARLQGASFSRAKINGASLNSAHLHGANFQNADLALASFSEARVWRANGAICATSRVVEPIVDAVIDLENNRTGLEKITAITPDVIAAFVASTVADVPDGQQVALKVQLRTRLEPKSELVEKSKKEWTDCAASTKRIPKDEFDQKHLSLLTQLACQAGRNHGAVAAGIAANWVFELNEIPDRKDFTIALSRGLLNEGDCATAGDLSDEVRKELCALAAPLPTAFSKCK